MIDLQAALLTAIGAETTALVGLFWLYVRQRDHNDHRYQAFAKEQFTLLADLRSIATEMNNLVRGMLVRQAGGG